MQNANPQVCRIPISKITLTSLNNHSNTTIPHCFNALEIHPDRNLVDFILFLASSTYSIDIAFSFNSPYTCIACRQLYLYLIPRDLPYSVPTQNILPTSSLPKHILYHLVLCLLTLPHSLYLFPKHLFAFLGIII